MRERAALAERHVVQVHLEDLVLRRARREDDRHPDLEQLAPRRLLARLLQRHAREHLRQEDVARQLLRDRAARRRCSARLPRMFDRTRADDADRIDARDARRSGDPRSASTACTMRAGMADSATGRRFSRSPPTSDVSTGASSVSRSLGLRAELEPLARDRRRAVGGALRRRRFGVGAGAAAERRRGRPGPCSSRRAA